MSLLPVVTEAKKEGASGLALAAALFGGEGEVKVESTESDRKFCLGVFADAIYERRNTPIGSFVHVKHAIKTPYLTTVGTPSFTLELPKPPVGLLSGVATFFRKIMRTMSNCEVMVQIYWCISEEKYKIYVPVQRVSGAAISFDHSTDLQNNPDMYWVFDIHSHNTMGAFFSGTDSADEKSTRVFGVLGKLNQTEFASVWRAGVNGKFVAQTKEDVWDMERTAEWVIPDTILTRVTRRVYQAQAGYRAPSQVSGSKVHGGQAKWINKGNQYQPYRAAAAWQHGGHDYMDEGPFNYSSIHSADYDSEVLDAWGADADPEIIIECEAMKEEVEKLYMAANAGTLGGTELTMTTRAFVNCLSEFESFDKNTGIAMLDQLSANMTSDDFNGMLKTYFDYFDVA
jgi:PRTRC genetic system protein A